MEKNRAFTEHFSRILGTDSEAFFASLEPMPSKHIRMNTKRGINYLPEIAEHGIILENDRRFPAVYKVLEGAEKLTSTVSFQTGGFYIQNPSSVFPPDVLCRFLPENPAVMDVSAAPGGKTVALCDMLKNSGVVVANEPSAKRLRSLEFNLEKYGCWSAKTVSFDGRVLDRHMEEAFDGILLDAPCSNENKIFRNETVNASWEPALVERMAKLQREILESAFKCLKKGGVLVYSTCTFSVEENEAVIGSFLADNDEAELLDISEGEMTFGISGNSEVDEKVLRVMPHKLPYDGFFIAALRRRGDEADGCSMKIRRDRQLDSLFYELPANLSVSQGSNIAYIETGCVLEARVRLSKSGILLWKRPGELSAQCAWELGANLRPEYRAETDLNSAQRYLKGFDTDKTSDYHTPVLYYGDVPVGTVKTVDGKFKNKLDRYFLYGKNIEF
ncbi:RsmB/NOP family class I SAM-dependent RNA methyltransferase [Geovibrio ferrireducens]|uniref:RsmB/NOP family class I SAM-dependent RNA methyltransferase n=1 Tax=Geovibrio ferrireducens TaxID=46201 RepID=UPI00224845BF|nr:RsmB/NOP family class I SAM-dependent RNA methyltransferase [Geovibrio ferrireducens]